MNLLIINFAKNTYKKNIFALIGKNNLLKLLWIMQKKLDLSVIIPTRNRLKLLKRTINQLSKNRFFFKTEGFIEFLTVSKRCK